MDLKLKNKKVFVSGSSKGIGLTIAKTFLEEGAQVVINSRNKNELNATANLFKKCNSVTGDVSNPEEAALVIKKTSEILGGIDIIVCNVGSGSSVVPGNENYNEWQRVFAINFFSTTNLIESARHHLKKSQGSIICISSICGNETIHGAPVTYSVAKAALNSYVKSISIPLGLDGIRINSVSPGNINFKGSTWEKKLVEAPKLVEEMLINNVPLNKLGSPSDVANMVVWLASDVANFVTGTVLTTDGGQTRA